MLAKNPEGAASNVLSKATMALKTAYWLAEQLALVHSELMNDTNTDAPIPVVKFSIPMVMTKALIS
jgi:hypothetical protein